MSDGRDEVMAGALETVVQAPDTAPRLAAGEVGVPDEGAALLRRLVATTPAFAQAPPQCAATAGLVLRMASVSVCATPGMVGVNQCLFRSELVPVDATKRPALPL